MALPAHDSGCPDAAFVKRALAIAQTHGGVEKCGIGSCQAGVGSVEGSIVRGEDKERVFIQPQFIDQLHEPADFAIHARDHRGVGCTRGEVRQIAFAALVRRVFPETLILAQRVVRHLQGQMWNRRGPVEEEWPVLVVPGKTQCLFGDQIGRVLRALKTFVAPGFRRVFAGLERVV